MSRADAPRQPVDLDLLADYAAGALDPAAADEVADLVRTDDRWARALEALTRADETVRAELRDLTLADLTMPPDVAARLESALTEAASPSRSNVVSIVAARARRRRLMTGVTAAAATLVLFVCGLAVVKGVYRSETASTSAGGAAQDAGAPAREGQAPPAVKPSPPAGTGSSSALVVAATNGDYTTQDLRQLLDKPAPDYVRDGGPGKTTSDTAAPVAPQPLPLSVPPALSRLAAPDALAACLAALRGPHPGEPALIDYARFEGRPALIIQIRSGTAVTVVAVGEQCGLSGPDELRVATTG
jgi:hypothetical protein